MSKIIIDEILKLKVKIQHSIKRINRLKQSAPTTLISVVSYEQTLLTTGSRHIAGILAQACHMISVGPFLELLLGGSNVLLLSLPRFQDTSLQSTSVGEG